MEAPTLDAIQEATGVVHQYLPPTLLYRWPLLADRLDCNLHLKHENHQPTGAFKVRGGINLFSRLDAETRKRGVIGCSTGNHGQSLAYAAREFEIPCTIVVPVGNNPGKNASIKALGAELIEHGADFDDARSHCETLVEKSGKRYIHSANEPDLISGVGSMAMEIFDSVTPDVIVVPIGLGSGICGTALVAASRSPQTQVIGVQAEGAPAVAETWRTGNWTSFDSIQTFAEGLATRSPASLTMDIMREHVSDIVLVSDDEIRTAMNWIIHDTHNLPEPAGAATTAAVAKMGEPLQGKTVVAILSGGNCDVREIKSILTQS